MIISLFISPQLLACTDLGAWQGGGGILAVISNQNFVPFIATNPHHSEFVYGAFGHETVGAMLRWLLVPRPDVRDRIERIRGQAGNKTLIGIQVCKR